MLLSILRVTGHHAHNSKPRAVLPGIRIESNTTVVMSHSVEMLIDHRLWCTKRAWKTTGHEMPLYCKMNRAAPSQLLCLGQDVLQITNSVFSNPQPPWAAPNGP